MTSLRRHGAAVVLLVMALSGCAAGTGRGPDGSQPNPYEQLVPDLPVSEVPPGPAPRSTAELAMAEQPHVAGPEAGVSTEEPASAAEAASPPKPTLPGDPSLLAMPDPLEPFNRGAYRFNYELDHYLFLPVVEGYRAVVPSPIRTGVANFFNNLLEVSNATNGLLQIRPEVASRAVIRFLVNSTFGVLGLFDVAGGLGLHAQREDFGQTLGRWGVPAGPYLVLPLLGPSGVRDATGFAADMAATFYLPPGSDLAAVVYADPTAVALSAVNSRKAVNFRYYETGSPFEYEIVRFLYRQQRELAVQQ